MGVFEQFPYANMHEMNLDWLLKKMKELAQAMETFKATESLKFADPIIWDITTQYQKSTIVLDPSGNAYLSKEVVPSGVQLNNTDYWLEIFNFTDYTRTANRNLTVNVETNTTRATADYQVDDWLIWEDVLYRVTAAIAIDDALIVAPAAGSNIIHFTVEDFIKAFITYATGLINQYKDDIDASELAYQSAMQAEVDRILAGATVDSEVIDARLGANGVNYPTLGAAIRGQFNDVNTSLTGNDLAIPVISWINGYRINNSGTTLGTATPNASWRYFRESCSEGDIFCINVNTDSWTSYRPYAFVDASNNIIEKSNTSAVVTNLIATAPAGAVAIIVNDMNSGSDCFIGTPLSLITMQFKGVCAQDLNTVVDVGYYLIPNNAINLPTDYAGIVGLLKVYKPGITAVYAYQELTGAAPTTPTYHRYISADGSGARVSAWTKNASENDITAINNNISDIEQIIDENMLGVELNGWVDGYRCSTIYDTIGPITAIAGWRYLMVQCVEGDVFSINVNTDNWSSYRPYAFVDSSDNIIEKGMTSGVVTNLQIKAPSGAVKLYINDMNSGSVCYKNVPLDKKDVLANKTVICDGDSICRASTDTPWNIGGYYGRLKINHQINGKNYAVSGATITAGTYSGDTPRHWISRSIDSIHNEYPNLDYLILEGGINDPANVAAGNYGTWDPNDFSGNYDDTKYCGAIESLFYKALMYYPNAKIGFIIIPEGGTVSSTINKRREWFDELKDIAQKWHVPVLDMWQTLTADARLLSFYDNTKTTQENVDLKHFYMDGLHPTSYGFNKMQNMIEKWIISL